MYTINRLNRKFVLRSIKEKYDVNRQNNSTIIMRRDPETTQLPYHIHANTGWHMKKN